MIACRDCGRAGNGTHVCDVRDVLVIAQARRIAELEAMNDGLFPGVPPDIEMLGEKAIHGFLAGCSAYRNRVKAALSGREDGQ